MTTLLGARHLTHPALLFGKAILFLLLGLGSGALIVQRSPQLSTSLLLMVCIWSFARLYYFAFYVIDRYLGKSVRISGVWAGLLRLSQHRRRNSGDAPAG